MKYLMCLGTYMRLKTSLYNSQWHTDLQGIKICWCKQSLHTAACLWALGFILVLVLQSPTQGCKQTAEGQRNILKNMQPMDTGLHQANSGRPTQYLKKLGEPMDTGLHQADSGRPTQYLEKTLWSK